MNAQNFVLDASVTLVWCFKDEDNDFAEQILERLAQAEAFVPTLWLSEVANVLALAERRNRLKNLQTAALRCGVNLL
ncbi:MAG: hypothetical protein OHK0052_10960 [Anaerolineales bacterium]